MELWIEAAAALGSEAEFTSISFSTYSDPNRHFLIFIALWHGKILNIAGRAPHKLFLKVGMLRYNFWNFT